MYKIRDLHINDLYKEYSSLLNQLSKTKVYFEQFKEFIDNLNEKHLVKVIEIDNKIYNAIFIKIMEMYGEKYAKLEIKTKNQSGIQYIPIRKTIDRVLIPTAKKYIDSAFIDNRTEREDTFRLGTEIKNSHRGFEKKYLTSEESNELKLSHTSKIHIISEKKSTMLQLKEFDICKYNQETQEYDPYKKLGIFNDLIRVKDFVNDGESFFSSISSPLTPKNYEITKDVKFKIYLGSNSFMKLHEDEDEKANSIIILSPKENNFENSIFAFHKRFSERRYLDIENFDSLKNLNMNFPAMIFRER